jgi:hypothetical protein
LEDGFSKVSSVSTSAAETKANNSTISGSLSSAALSLFNISLDGKVDKTSEKGTSIQDSKEKIHTPTSLFSKLRLMLHEMELVYTIKNVSELSDLKCGDFVEFRSNLINNPLINALSSTKELLIMSFKYSHNNINNIDSSQTDQNKKINVQNTRKKNKNNQTIQSETITENGEVNKAQENELMLKLLGELLDDLTKSNSTEIVGKILEDPRINVDLSSKTNCFIDNDISLVMNGEFYVFGKVTQVIPHNYQNTINLLQKTTFRLLGEEVIKPFIDSFNDVPSAIVLPKIVTKIESPAIQVLPIAIFITSASIPIYIHK